MKRVLAAATCSLVSAASGCYWLASYEDLTSAIGDAGEAVDEAGQVASDGSPRPDAGSAADGSSSAPFCPPDAGPLSYCMDFDGVATSSLGLGVHAADAGIVDGTYVSPPSSLAVALAGSPSNAAYSVPFAFQPTSARLEFKLRVSGLSGSVTTFCIALFAEATQTLELLNVVVSGGGAFQVQEYFELADGGTALSAHTTSTVVSPSGSLDAGAESADWHHVVLTLTANDASHVYLSALTVDGQVLESARALGLAWAQGKASIGVGVTYAGSGGAQFFFDDVRADFGL